MGTNMRRRQLGQSIVEFAIATPVLLVLLLGAFNTGVMISDKVIAGAACRQGARLAAEIGGQITNPLLTTAQVDANIVKNVLAVASAMNYSTLSTITIYAPVNPDGDFHAGDSYNQYNTAGNLVAGGGFTLAQRIQVPPNETSIGVRLDWAYVPPTGFQSFNINLNEHAVMKASPVLV
jgi:Flp pilus assembly protein TadG